jgi:hypothetical protein
MPQLTRRALALLLSIIAVLALASPVQAADAWTEGP